MEPQVQPGQHGQEEQPSPKAILFFGVGLAAVSLAATVCLYVVGEMLVVLIRSGVGPMILPFLILSIVLTGVWIAYRNYVLPE
jgi:hypothetical protein